jgi:nitrate reductase gamma subunit
MLFFVGEVLPYIASAVFVFALLWRVARWLRVPVPFPLTLGPSGRRQGLGRVMALGREVLLFDSLRRGSGMLWWWAWLLHISLIAIIVGHVAGIYYLTRQFTLIGLSAETSSRLSALSGTLCGTAFAVALVVLFSRRIVIAEVRRLSCVADYFILVLLLAIAVSGMSMRLGDDAVELAAVRAYAAGLLTLQPVPIPHPWAFISHLTLVNVLLLYLPFSKLIHMVGIFFGRALVTQPPAGYPTPVGAGCRISFTEGAAGHER